VGAGEGVVVAPHSPPPSPAQVPSKRANPLAGCRSIDCYERLNRISEGTFGVVFRARERETGGVYAVKKIKMDREREGFPLTSLREINLLLRLSHPNIINVTEVVVGASLDSVFMVMDFMEHDLKELVERMRKPFSAGEVKCLMRQLLSGMSYMHDHWQIHRDLKTSNVLLSNRGVLKICDFGLAREYGSPVRAYTALVVTLHYRAPELLLGAPTYSTPVDVWSLGCIMGELLRKRTLFEGKSEIEQLDKIYQLLGTPNESVWPGVGDLPHFASLRLRPQPYNNMRREFPKVSHQGKPTLSDLGFDLLMGMLCYDPRRRISAEEALSHGWFQEFPPPTDPELMPTFPSKAAAAPQPPREPSPDPLEAELERRRREEVRALRRGL